MKELILIIIMLGIFFSGLMAGKDLGYQQGLEQGTQRGWERHADHMGQMTPAELNAYLIDGINTPYKETN